MKHVLLTTMLIGLFSIANTQTVEELKSMKAEKDSAASELQAQADALKAEAASLQNKIDIMSGWRRGLNGLAGFNFNRSQGWIANPNSDATSVGLNIGLTGVANLTKTKYFWNNKLIVAKAWQDIITDPDREKLDLFANTTSDIVNLSSLGGYKFNSKLAASALGEINTSTSNFFAPGTIDIGAGVTWLPIQNMTVVIHPLNYNIKFPADGLGIETQGALGAKLRVDYFKDIMIASKKFNWSTTLTSFLPYQDKISVLPLSDGSSYEAGLFEYTWLNTISFELWRGIGVGVSFGFRDAALESPDVQAFQSVGITYGFNY